MIRHRSRTVAVALTGLAALAHAEIQTTVEDGGTVVTSEGYNKLDYDLNEGSSLRRSWVTLNDTTSPIAITKATFSVVGRSGDFSFGATVQMKPSVPVSAFEIRLLLFDVFGSPLTAFRQLKIRDHDAGDTVPLSGNWDLTRTEAEELLTAVVYIASVRTQAGVVWQHRKEEIAQSVLQLDLMAIGEDREAKDVQ